MHRQRGGTSDRFARLSSSRNSFVGCPLVGATQEIHGLAPTSPATFLPQLKHHMRPADAARVDAEFPADVAWRRRIAEIAELPDLEGHTRATAYVTAGAPETLPHDRHLGAHASLVAVLAAQCPT